MIPFFKYQGTGNDFIMLDNRVANFQPSPEAIANLCHRRFGIGADGLIMLSPHADLDFSMDYYNSDGHTSSMCGNGGRCIAAFAHQLGIIDGKTRFMAIDGEHEASVQAQPLGSFQVSLKMRVVNDFQDEGDTIIMNTGSPHFVAFVPDPLKCDVVNEGRKIRNSSRFQSDGINVNFVAERSHGIIVRTYERGVEDETLSCGTGVTASALAYSLKKGIAEGPVQVETKGGKLEVHFRKNKNSFVDIWLSGEVKYVFQGSISESDL